MAMDASAGGGFTTSAPTIGIGGSMARFTIVNDYLYAVSNSDLYSVTINNPANPVQTATINLGWGIETIYPFQNNLFIGSMTGMFIYSLSDPARPIELGRFNHARSCDPVIADGNYAYVTLRSGTNCNTNTNQLDVIDITNLSAPALKKTTGMTNPHGLSKDGNVLFICDGKAGLRIYNASVPEALQPIKHIQGIETFDVIARNGKAIVVAKDGLYQFDYTNLQNIHQLSKLSIGKN
jgi:hypothetical protein